MPALVRAQVLALAQAPLRALVEMATALRTKRTELVAKPSHSSVCGRCHSLWQYHLWHA